MIYLNTVQRVAKNTGIVIAGDVIFRVISLFITIYLARYLGIVGFGKYSFVFAYLAFFGVITSLGLNTILVREMARDPSMTSKLIGNAYIIKILLTVFAIVLSLIIITLLPYPADTTNYVYIAAFTLLFLSFSDLYGTIFQANLRMEYRIIAKLVFKVLSGGLILWIIFSQGTLTQVILALVFSEMVKTLISYRFSRKIVRAQFDIDPGLLKYLVKVSLPLAFSSVIITIYYHIDIVMLSLMQGDASVGIYSAAYKLSEPLSLIPSAFMVSLFPIMSASFKNSKERILKSYRLGIRYLLIIALPIAMCITLLSDKIILLIYKAPFAESATVLQILIWVLVFISLHYVLTNILISIEKQKLYMICTGLCAIVNLTLNFILIPILSYNGAAIATVATNVVLFMASFYFVSKHLFILPIHKLIVKPVIGCFAMGAFIYCFVDFINVFLLVPLALVVYLAALLALRTFTKEDIDIVKNALSYRK